MAWDSASASFTPAEKKNSLICRGVIRFKSYYLRSLLLFRTKYFQFLLINKDVLNSKPFINLSHAIDIKRFLVIVSQTERKLKKNVRRA